MTTDIATTYYASRRLYLPPRVAQAAYDQQPRIVTLRDRRAGLTLTDRLVAADSGGPGYRSLRRDRGQLRTPLWRFTVELELLPWSAGDTELGLRPMRWGVCRWPPSYYLEVAHEILAATRAAMTAWAETPLRQAVAELSVT